MLRQRLSMNCVPGTTAGLHHETGAAGADGTTLLLPCAPDKPLPLHAEPSALHLHFELQDRSQEACKWMVGVSALRERPAVVTERCRRFNETISEV
jgi:hypothetical protein